MELLILEFQWIFLYSFKFVCDFDIWGLGKKTRPQNSNLGLKTLLSENFGKYANNKKTFLTKTRLLNLRVAYVKMG